MRIDYDGIKALSKELGIRATDLIAMTPQADPFYAGLPARQAEARWFAELWERFGWGQGQHLRRAHYQLVVLAEPVMKPTGDSYVNDGASWGLLKRASLAARYHNLIPAGSLIDRKNPTPLIFAVNNTIAGAVPKVEMIFRNPGWQSDLPADLDLSDELYPPRFSIDHIDDGQPFLVELWIEKTTQNDILVPVASRLGVNLVPGQGDTSEIQARAAVERAIEARRPMRILYISDFDPRGHKMPVGLARKIEFLLREGDLDLDITLTPIILTPEQCEHYALPRKPFEKGGAGSFEEQFGEGGTELDALEAIHPGEIARIVEQEVCRYIDPTLSSRCRSTYWDVERWLRDHSEEIREPFEEDISGINQRYVDIRKMLQDAIDEAKDDMADLRDDAIKLWDQVAKKLEESGIPEISEESIPFARAATPPAAPLFDSRRDYLDQIDHYRAWQGKGGAG